MLGHANQLADPRFAGLYRSVAGAARRLETPEALSFLSKLFWYTVEFGVTRADPGGSGASSAGEPRAYGAGLLSSYGELRAFASAERRPVDWAAMGTRSYDITHYQTVLYEVPSLEWLFEEFPAFLSGFDDEACARLVGSAPAPPGMTSR